MQVRFFRSFCISLGNIPVLGHLVEDDGLAVFGCFYTAEWRVVVRAVRKACEHGALRKGQIFHIFVEIDAGGGLDAVAALTEVNLVHVHFKNLFLGVLAFNFKSQHHFEKFSLDGLFLCEESVAGQLLGDGGTTLTGGIPGNEVRPDSAENPSGVHPVMFIETHVFCSHEGILQILGHFFDGNGNTVFLCMDGRDKPPLFIINAGRRVGLDVGGHIRKISSDGNKETCRSPGPRNEDDDQKKYDDLREEGRFLLWPDTANI